LDDPDCSKTYVDTPVIIIYDRVKLVLTFTELGDPADDLAVATVLMMVGGQLVLLRPRKVSFLSIRSNFYLYIDVRLVGQPRSQV